MSEQQAAATGAAGSSKKKKDRVIVKPTPPASVSTALLILRGAIAGVLGCPIGGKSTSTPSVANSNANDNANTERGSEPIVFSLMQPSYIKDKYPSGKFSLSLGKKNGTACTLHIPSSTESEDVSGYTQSQLLDAIEQAANRIITDNIPIMTYTMNRNEAIFYLWWYSYARSGADQGTQKKQEY